MILKKQNNRQPSETPVAGCGTPCSRSALAPLVVLAVALASTSWACAQIPVPAPAPAGAIKAPTATPASPPRTEPNPVRIKVEQPSKTDIEGDTKTVKRALKISVVNSSNEPLELKLKYVLFGRDAADKDIKAIDQGDRPAPVKPRSTEIVETGTATAVFVEARFDPGTHKRVPASGTKFVGYGVQVLLGDRLVAESYDPPSMKASWGQAPAAPAAPAAAAAPAAGKRAGKAGGLGL